MEIGMSDIPLLDKIVVKDIVRLLADLSAEAMRGCHWLCGVRRRKGHFLIHVARRIDAEPGSNRAWIGNMPAQSRVIQNNFLREPESTAGLWGHSVHLVTPQVQYSKDLSTHNIPGLTLLEVRVQYRTVSTRAGVFKNREDHKERRRRFSQDYCARCVHHCASRPSTSSSQEARHVA